MCDIFIPSDIRRIFKGKSILFLGDSIMRNIYKDFVYMVTDERRDNTIFKYIPTRHMRTKGEKEFCGDKLISERNPPRTPGRDYVEERDLYMKRDDLQFTFCFITRVFTVRIKEFLEGYPKEFGSYPDVIIINSALWDINRWGPNGVRSIGRNVHKLMQHITRCLRRTRAEHTQVIWMTTPPISTEIRGGIMVEQLEFQKLSMRFNVMEMNHYTAKAAACYGFDVLDMHYYMCNQIHRRCPDGVHWNKDAVRMQMNIILTHYCLSREIPLPGRMPLEGNIMLQEAVDIADVARREYHIDRVIPQRKRRHENNYRGQRHQRHGHQHQRPSPHMNQYEQNQKHRLEQNHHHHRHYHDRHQYDQYDGRQYDRRHNDRHQYDRHQYDRHSRDHSSSSSSSSGARKFVKAKRRRYEQRH